MPAVSRMKTYSKTRKSEHNYSTSSQNSLLFPITGASTAIDSLLAKNIEKRNSSIKEENRIKTKSTKKGKLGKKLSSKIPRLLQDDSFDLTINTTFENLLKAPDLRPVKYCNVSLICGNSSTDNTNLKNDDMDFKEKPPLKVQKTYERKVKRGTLSQGKAIKRNKSNKKNLLQLVKKVQNTPEISFTGVDESMLQEQNDSYSEINKNGSSVSVARKFTPIASTSKILTTISKNNSLLFQPGLRHCMQAQNSPNYLASSTPLIPRNIRTREDFSLSPITAKKELNFKSGWKSLFESDKTADNSLPSTSIKDHVSNVILINSTIEKSSIMPNIINKYQYNLPNIIDENVYFKNNSIIKNDIKFNAVPIVIIEDDTNIIDRNHLFESDNNKRKLLDVTDSLDVKQIYSPRVDLTQYSFSNYYNKQKNTNFQNIHLLQSPIIDLTQYSFSKYLSTNVNKSLSANVNTIKINNDNFKTSPIKMTLRSRSRSHSKDSFNKSTFRSKSLCPENNNNAQLKDSISKIQIKKKTKHKTNVQGIGLRTRSHKIKSDNDEKNNVATPRKARTMSLRTRSITTVEHKSRTKTKSKIIKNIVQVIPEIEPEKLVHRLRSSSVCLDVINFNSTSDGSVFEKSNIKNKSPTRSKSIAHVNSQKPKTKMHQLRTRSNTIENNSRSINLRSSQLKDTETNRKSTNNLRTNKSTENLVKFSNIIDELNSSNTNVAQNDVENTIRRSSRPRRKSVRIDDEIYSDWDEFRRKSSIKVDNTSVSNKKTELGNNLLKTPKLNDTTTCSNLIANISPHCDKTVLTYKTKPRTRSNSVWIINDSHTNTIINITDKSLFSSASSSNTDVIENSINETVKKSSFITTRRGNTNKDKKFITKKRGSSRDKVPSPTREEIKNHQTASLQDWERFSQSNINSIKIDDLDNIEWPQINTTNKNNKNTNEISDTFADEIATNIFLKPGKQWFRSLSILQRTNIHNISLKDNSNKGRKWRESVCAVFDQQEKSSGVLIDTSDNQHKELYNIAKNLQISRIKSLSRRTTLQIVPISNLKDFSVCRNVNSILEDTEVASNKSGYVSTLADESQSILASFDKLSLTTNVEEREETARQIILKRCGQTTPLSFDDCYSKRLLTRCRKIGEGVYGEVFMCKSLDEQCRVMKVIPIEGNLVVNGEHQKKFEEIISEIIIASELSNLRNNNEFSTNGFNELLKICCVQGKYPQHLLDLWNLYDEEQGSENDSPEIFTDEQLYIVLELANGGQDLEAYRFNNAEQSFAVFAQVVCSLAVAESALQFEHRDMHWGNILISPTNETTTSFRLNGRELEIATKGVNVSIIDFTLSRMTYNKCCIFNDLALDPDLFTATGDYQFDIYRLMRQRNQDDWQRFEPYSNILWLDYTLEKMITQLRYLRINTKTHKTNIRRLTQMRKKIFNYNSATELLNSDAFSQVFLY